MMLFIKAPRDRFGKAKFTLSIWHIMRNVIDVQSTSRKPNLGLEIKAPTTMALQLTWKRMWPVFCLTESDLPWGQCSNKTPLQHTEFKFNWSLLLPHFSYRFYAVNPVVKRRQGVFWHSARCIDAWDGCVALKTTFSKGQRKHLRL